MVKQKQVHVVPHMHWDREWYFSTEESQILLVNNMAEIIDMLEQHPEYPAYVLDGQTAILEDYFQAVPENRERIKKLVAAGRLKIGPWYTQTDEMIVGGESMTRNLLYGFKDSHKLGEPMKIGYVPDSFGQSAQAPQILNQFGIEHSIFWRGMSERHGTSKTEFNWISSEGSQVLVQQFPLGYAIGKYLPTDRDKLKTRMDKLFITLDRGASSENELLPNGHDQMPIQRNIFEVIKQLNDLYPERNFFLSTYENLFDQLMKSHQFDTIEGELLDGKYERVHRSIYSTRMDLKTANARIENKLTNILEPLASLGHHLGLTYHQGLLEYIWKELMKNHAHDSIGACCSDKVHREIKARFDNVEERIDRLIDFYKRRIAEAAPIGTDNDKLVLFNFSAIKTARRVQATIITKQLGFDLIDDAGKKVNFTVLKKENIDPGLIDRQIVAQGNYEPFYAYTIEFNHGIPAYGYTTLMVHPAAELEITLKSVETIKTDFYEIQIANDGTLTITDRESGVIYDHVFALENQADDGDEYDFSPLKGDHPLYSNNQVQAVTKIMESQVAYHVQISYSFNVPADLQERQRENAQKKPIMVKMNLLIGKKDRTIAVEIKLNNQAKDQRTRLLIPTKIAAKVAYADNQFGTIERSVTDPAMAVWQQEHWDERPDAIYPFLSHVSLSAEQTVSILTNSSREYEVIGAKKDILAITLLRSVGTLGKADLVRRPGRPSGINAPTPDSQMLGDLTLEFGLQIMPKPYTECNVAAAAKNYLTPVVTYNLIPFQAMHLNPSGLQMPLENHLTVPQQAGITLSVIKKAEDSDVLLARFFNASERSVQLNSSFTKHQFRRLDESQSKSLSVVKPNQVFTIELD